MVKRAALICIALVFCACAGSGAANSGQKSSEAFDGFWVTLPKPDTLFIIGVSGRQLKRENEIELARQDAARKAAMYHGLDVSFESLQNIGANVFDYYTGSEINLDYDRELEKYKEKLVFDENKDVISSERGIFIRFSYPAPFPGNISYAFAKNRDGRPEWTNNPPGEIDGLAAGVGFSGKLFYFGDTFEKSCDAAAADIVSRLSTVVTTKDTSMGYQNSSFMHQLSEGYLVRFLVLEIWIDPATQAVWTLAAAGRQE
jgi:hypothetical protein